MCDDDDEVPLEELITIQQLAEELWCKATSSTEMGWKTLPVLQEASLAKPRADGGHDLAQEGRAAVGRCHPKPGLCARPPLLCPVGWSASMRSEAALAVRESRAGRYSYQSPA